VNEIINEMINYPFSRFSFEKNDTRPHLFVLYINNRGKKIEICEIYYFRQPDEIKYGYVSNNNYVYIQNYERRQNNTSKIEIDSIENGELYLDFDISKFQSINFEVYLDYLFKLKDDVYKMLNYDG